MEGATLTIAFKDESTPGASGSAGTSALPSAQNQAEQQLQDQLKALIAGGGVAVVSAKNLQVTTASSPSLPIASTQVQVPVTQPLPSPAVSTTAMPSGESALAQSIQTIQAADPKATAKEIAELLGGGITQNQVQRYLNQGYQQQAPTVTPPKPLVTPTNQPDEVERMISGLKQHSADDLVKSTLDTWKTETAQQEEAAKKAQDLARKPPPAPLAEPPVVKVPIIGPTAEEAAAGAQATVNALAHFAHGFGPLGSAAAGVATSTLAIPGVASAVAGAAPALIAAAPVIAVAGAATAVPYTMGRVVEGAIQSARMQISGLSGEVVAAEANASIRQFIQNVRTAQRIGPEVAESTTISSIAAAARQELRDTTVSAFSDPWNNIKTVFTGLLIGVQQNIAALTGNKESMDRLNELMRDLLNNTLPGGQQALGLYGIIPENPQLPPPFAQRPSTYGNPKSPGSKPWISTEQVSRTTFTGLARP